MIQRLVLSLALAIGLPLSLAAQLDLPDKGDRPAAETKGRQGTKRPASRDAKERGGLDLPGSTTGASPVTTGGAESPPGAASAEEAADAALGYEASYEGAASYIYDQLARLADPAGNVADQAVESLAALGGQGLLAAREHLSAKRASMLVVSARVLLAHGTQADRQLVVERMQRKVPSEAAPILVASLVAHDPVLATPELFVQWLDHPSGSMRGASQRLLASRVTERHLPLLAQALRSTRADTRLRALELLGRIDDPTVSHLVMDRLGDTSASVAALASSYFASASEEEVAELLDRVLPPELVAAGESGRTLFLDRAAGYGLLAILEREDTTGAAILQDEHAPVLLRHLGRPPELVSGAAAAALAGIGFRSARSRRMEWLDRQVPHELVRLSSGAVFHKDLSSLRVPLTRRLGLITGQNFGADGPRWQQWWTSAAADFRAHRAVIELVGPEEHGTLALSIGSRLPGRELFLLRGPDAKAPEGIVEATTVFLADSECTEVVSLLRREGILGRERVPGRMGTDIPTRVLDLSISNQGKRFELSRSVDAVWYERIHAVARTLAERHRWQLFRDPRQHASQREFWLSESPFWQDPERSPGDRLARRKELLFAALAGTELERRDAALEELVAVMQGTAGAAPGDFPRITALLEDETYYGGRARALVELALAAGRSASAGEAAGARSGLLDLSLSQRLMDLLIERFGDAAEEDLVRCLAASGREVVRRVAMDERTFLRGLAAAALADEPNEADEELLIELLDDPDELVERAAVQALGANRVESARTELLVRARLASPRVRSSALIAIGRLGGEGVLDALMVGLADADALTKRGAVEGLAELADPESSSLLVSLFARGPESSYFEPARRGLVRLGAAAHGDLIRVMLSAAGTSRREAAFLLSEQGAPEAATTLISILTDDPTDGRVAMELCVLTGVDLRGEPEPARAWWGWWDQVVHDDSLAWLCGAVERVGLTAPPVSALRGSGDPAGHGFLMELLALEELHLVERARREVGRMLGRDPGSLPPRGSERTAWTARLASELEQVGRDSR